MNAKLSFRFIAVLAVILCSFILPGCEKSQLVEQSVSVSSYSDVWKDSPVTNSNIREEIQWMFDNKYINSDTYAEYIKNGPKYSQTPDGTLYYSYGDEMVLKSFVEQQAASNSGSRNARHRVNSTMYAGGTLKVRIHPYVSPEWKTAITQAISAWNALGYNAKFSSYETTSMSEVAGEVDVFLTAFSPSSRYAQVSNLTTTAGGEVMQINSAYVGIVPIASSKKQIMAHELGHALGFKHTDTTDGNLATQSVLCNQSAETGSLMNDMWGPSWSYAGFTSCDISNIAYYWPKKWLLS